LGPINAYRFTSYRNLKEGYFQYSKWICTLIPDLSRSGSAILNERNRTKSSTTHFLTNGTELKVQFQKVSEPTRNRRQSSLILRFPKSSRNCTNERPALTYSSYRTTATVGLSIENSWKNKMIVRITDCPQSLHSCLSQVFKSACKRPEPETPRNLSKS